MLRRSVPALDYDGLHACRQQQAAEADDVATGAGHSRILQRLKLNSQVALVTGAPGHSGFMGISPQTANI